MSKSRARYLAELLGATGLVRSNRSALAGEDGVIDLDNLPTIPNAKLEHSSVSIAGHTLSLGGTLTLNTADIGEHASYLYYTDARARAAVSASGSLSYDSATGVFSFTERTDSEVRGLVSASGSLSYDSATGVFSFTERTDSEVRGLVSASGSLSYDSATGVFSYTTPTTIASLSNHSTDGLSEGSTNLYFTNARARSAISVSGAGSYDSASGVITITGGVTSVNSQTGAVSLDTDDVSEGLSNLYYTDARARAALSVTGSGSYNSTTGVITITGGVSSVNSQTGAVSLDTDDVSEGSTNLYYTDARVGSYLTSNSYATQSYVGTQIANLVDSAPGTLDTLNELAAALGDDANFSTTVTNSIATKWTQDNTKISNWDTAYGWGNHASAGYLTSFTETDPVFSASAASGITSTNITNWNTAYGWGNHASAGYLTGNQTITLTGDVSGSGTTSITVTIADDSHNHVISNVDGLQTALDAKLASSSYTASDVLTKIKTVDGSGSGLDADLLDGQHGSSYLRSDTSGTLSGSLFVNGQVYGGIGAVTTSGTTDWNHSTNARSGGGYTLLLGSHSNGPGGGSYYHPFSFEYSNKNGTGNMTQFAIPYQTHGIYYRSRYGGSWTGWASVWTSTNDGSGSGLDADLLDGQQGSYYQPASTAITTGNIGSQSVSSASNIDGISFRNGNSSNGTAPDNIAENGLGYINSVSLFSQTDGALYSQAYSSSWVHQIFGDYRTGYLAVRGRNNGTWQSWKTVWTSGNDGSGSGLDADLLDGIQGSSFLRSDANDTATGVITFNGGSTSGFGPIITSSSAGGPALKINSTATSGKDWWIISNNTNNTDGAGRLQLWNNSDNFTAATIGTSASISTNLYTPLNISTGTNQPLKLTTSSGGPWAIELYRSDTGNSSKVFNSGSAWYFQHNISIASNTNWHAGNDGSGSGLDADLLDGLQLHTGRNNEASKVVRTDASGYIQAGWINSTSGASPTANRLTRITSSYDEYLRYMDPASFKVQIGESYKNTYSRSVDYSTNVHYWVGSFGHNGYGANETFHGGSGFFDIWSGTNYPGGFSHIHGFNALHYTTNSLGTTGGNAYGWQMATQYNSDAGPYFRRCNAGTFSAWRKIWHDGNDGSGSGLDADLLDGLNSSSFLRSDAATSGTTITATTALYAPRMYDSDNTNYSINPNGTTYYQYSGRLSHDTGHQVGSYNSVGANSYNSNPIYSIGSNYNPASTTLSNFYGIGYSNLNASFITAGDGWGLYVAADGDARIFLSGSNGGGYFNGDVTAYASDERLKENIKPIENALEKVLKLNGVEFDWKDEVEDLGFIPSTKHETGVIAQNVQEVVPDAVVPAPFNDEYLTVNKEKIIPLLIEAIKEQQKLIEELQKGVQK